MAPTATVEGSISGAMRLRMRPIWGSAGRRTSRNFRDSGAISATRRAIRRGAAPPIRKAPRQPNACSTGGAMKPAQKAPTGEVTFISPITNDRLASGAYSEVRAAQLGIPAPRATPVRRRQATNWPGVAARAVQAVATPMVVMAPTSMALRPNRSPSGPMTPEPREMPITTAESARPKLEAGRDQALARDGTARAITWMS